MAFFDRFRKSESRNIEDPNAPVSAYDFMQIMGWGDTHSTAGVTVNLDTAMGVPAIWAAVNFLSGTLAGLPLHVYRKTANGRVRSSGPLENILHDAPSDEMSSFEWRKYMFDQVFTGGRCVTYIERAGNGAVKNLFPLDPAKTRVEIRQDGKRQIKEYTCNNIRYAASEVIDVPFMLKSNFVDVRGPIMTNREAIGMAIAASRYGAKAFQSGGVPPAVLQGPFPSGAAAARASEDVAKTQAKLANDNRSIIALPLGHEIKPLGFKPNEMQLIELQRFSIEQVARIYSLPPVFLQDLTHGTFKNTEQQDLQFVKHTLKRWIEQVEQEMNLKLFPRGSKQYVEFNVDGLLRGDFKTRMEAHAASIQNAIRTPNEVRTIENMAAQEGGDKLMIQGATVPIESQGQLTESERSQIELNEATSRALNGQS